MSWHATSVTKGLCSNLTRSEKFLLLILADYHNDETHRCDPSIDRLAHDTLMSRSQTVRSLQALEEKGFISIEHRREDGRQTSNQYDLLFLGVTMPPCQHRIQGGVQSVIQSSTMTPEPISRTVRENHKGEPSLLTTTGKRPPIFALYENHIGTIDRHMADRLIEAEAEYSEECLRHSFAAASEHNVHNWKYVEAILERHKREGCYVEGPKKDRRGDGPKGSKPATAQAGPDLEPWRRYAAGEQ